MIDSLTVAAWAAGTGLVQWLLTRPALQPALGVIGLGTGADDADSWMGRRFALPAPWLHHHEPVSLGPRPVRARARRRRPRRTTPMTSRPRFHPHGLERGRFVMPTSPPQSGAPPTGAVMGRRSESHIYPPDHLPGGPRVRHYSRHRKSARRRPDHPQPNPAVAPAPHEMRAPHPDIVIEEHIEGEEDPGYRAP